jgi:hypothetical protein
VGNYYYYYCYYYYYYYIKDFNTSCEGRIRKRKGDDKLEEKERRGKGDVEVR